MSGKGFRQKILEILCFGVNKQLKVYFELLSI